MACDTSYLYNVIFMKCGNMIRDILLKPEDVIVKDTLTALPQNTYPIYETREEYDLDTKSENDANTTSPFKGLLVWHAHKYYTSIVNPEDQGSGYSADAGFYVIPVFGDVTIIPNIEYKQLLVVTFDSNADLDYDPYGTMITIVISEFVNNINKALEKYGNELLLDEDIDGRRLYTRVARITKSMPVAGTVFERRSVIIELRYCHCY